jgi:hypothetical protein
VGYMTIEEARAGLIGWSYKKRRLTASLDRLMTIRDENVRKAFAAGVSKQDIHHLTGIARTTIDRIIREQS